MPLGPGTAHLNFLQRSRSVMDASQNHFYPLYVCIYIHIVHQLVVLVIIQNFSGNHHALFSIMWCSVVFLNTTGSVPNYKWFLLL